MPRLATSAAGRQDYAYSTKCSVCVDSGRLALGIVVVWPTALVETPSEADFLSRKFPKPAKLRFFEACFAVLSWADRT